MKQKMYFIMAMLLSTVLVSCGNPSVEYNPETAGHAEYIVSLFSDSTGVTMTNAPVAGSEITNNISRAYVDLSTFTMVRGQFVSSLTSALIQCRIDYSLDDGTTWATLVPAFSASTTANANSNSTWGAIPSAANANVLLRAVIIGNGVLDPVIRYARVGYY